MTRASRRVPVGAVARVIYGTLGAAVMAVCLSCASAGNSPTQPTTVSSSLPVCSVATFQCSNGFGAIAYSPSAHYEGTGYNYSTQAAAENEAVSQCGHSDCVTVVWWENACGALATAPTGQYGGGTGTSATVAEADAVAACEAQ